MFKIQRKWKIQCQSQTSLSFGKELDIVYASTIKHNLSFRGYILAHVLIPLFLPNSIGLAYQGKDIVFRFIIEYSSLRDFYRPLGNNNNNNNNNRSIFYMSIFER